MSIILAGLDAAQPEGHLGKFITKNTILCAEKKYRTKHYDKIWLVAMGKAAYSMAKITRRIVSSDGGIVVIPKNYDYAKSKKFQVIQAGHPTPNKNSVLAARKIITLLQNAGPNDLVIFLVSGGASALVCLPHIITLQQKIKTTQILLESGASISEINAIRKHLSGIKGGKILESLCCDAISYVMSDVIGDDLVSIASGMTYCDNTTFSDCLRIVSKYGLGKKLPKTVLNTLHNGAAGKIPETPKRPKIPNQIIASNSDCLGVMAKKARSLGYDAVVYPNVGGNVRFAAKKILQKFKQSKKSCLVFGGETTVTIQGKGKGGRNQELVLYMISNLPKNATVASVGTDGIDGNTKHTGAIFDHTMDKKITQPYLDDNDSNTFFAKYGGLIKTGPTHTNLQDIGIILQHF
jgi:hydroxypyruvate reductase